MSEIPGPQSRSLRARLAEVESRNVTYLGDGFPVFWESASRATVVDADANRYVDLTAAFGVAAVGHANPAVAAAIAQQAQLLAHGMGDVHPTEIRVRLLERLVRIAPRGMERVFLATTGSEAVEAAMKTAMLATGKTSFAAYAGAYHGLSLGALVVCGQERFREPFAGALPSRPLLLGFPREDAALEDALEATRATLSARDDVAALFIEPVQARAGIVVPPQGYLRGVRDICDELGVLLVVDEIYTGFGRTGEWFACNRENVVPDLLCIGKAMGGGFPVSALLGTTRVMSAWPPSAGEALHTSTYLGNPMGCAAALATIDEIERLELCARAKRLGAKLAARLPTLLDMECVADVRGRGMMWGLELRDAATAGRAVKEALARGVILLQAGPTGEVLSITPPLVIAESELERGLSVVTTAIAAAA
ncbi:MAG: aspartate aminotransferase family protein [Candidatus Tyrphobacter sp.]